MFPNWPPTQPNAGLYYVEALDLLIKEILSPLNWHLVVDEAQFP